MRSYSLFIYLFWILILVLGVSIARNFMRGQSLLGGSEFALIGVIVFLVIGDEFGTFRVTDRGLEIDQGKEMSAVAPEGARDTKPNP